MTNEARPLILASGSPRRRELLGRMGYEFQICSPDVDEHVSGHARDIVRTLAVRKARAAAERFDRGVIIASDTLVSLDGAPLGKPADAADAKRMLRALSGRSHMVYTAVAVAQNGHTDLRTVSTEVFFRPMCDAEIDRYVATGEPMDKAGAYGIQGLGSVYVEGIRGDYFNVMGLPVSTLYTMLQEVENGDESQL